MAYEANILADSVSDNDDRLTTIEVTFPRMVLSEFNTHRMFSRNSASSRAIPVEKQLGKILDEPFIPTRWPVNQPGMQANEYLSNNEASKAVESWLVARDMAVLGATALICFDESFRKDKDGKLLPEGKVLKERILELDREYNYQLEKRLAPRPIHKQIANRELEPFMWHTVIVTATEWDNFYALRANPEAQPEIQKAAYMMRDTQENSAPELLSPEEYHLPLILEDEQNLPLETKIMVAIGRCARVSYLTHAGKRDIEKDVELYHRLTTSGHMSPTEHVAHPMTNEERSQNMFSGNFRGWNQYRKYLSNEENFAKVRAEVDPL